MASLSSAVKIRVKALKKLQLETTLIDGEFAKEVHALECHYQKRYAPLYEKRNAIVNGTYEPTEEESQWPSEDEVEDQELPALLKHKAKLEEKKEEVGPVKGIPDFWATVLTKANLVSGMVKRYDVPILKHLTNITTTLNDNPKGFQLAFHFSPNQYFTNAVLTKDYGIICTPDEADPFDFDGPSIFKSSGCTINWNKGKNVTLKTVKKMAKRNSCGVLPRVTITVHNESFFNFFSPPIIPEGTRTEYIDDDLRNTLTTDFEIGHYIRKQVVARAVLYFTGEGNDGEDFEEEEEEEDYVAPQSRHFDSDYRQDTENTAPPNCKQQ